MNKDEINNDREDKEVDGREHAIRNPHNSVAWTLFQGLIKLASVPWILLAIQCWVEFMIYGGSYKWIGVAGFLLLAVFPWLATRSETLALAAWRISPIVAVAGYLVVLSISWGGLTPTTEREAQDDQSIAAAIKQEETAEAEGWFIDREQADAAEKLTELVHLKSTADAVTHIYDQYNSVQPPKLLYKCKFDNRVLLSYATNNFLNYNGLLEKAKEGCASDIEIIQEER